MKNGGNYLFTFQINYYPYGLTYQSVSVPLEHVKVL